MSTNAEQQQEIVEEDIQSESIDDNMDDFDPLQQLGNLLVSADGETIPDVLSAIHESLEKLVKVQFKICQHLEKK